MIPSDGGTFESNGFSTWQKTFVTASSATRRNVSANVRGRDRLLLGTFIIVGYIAPTIGEMSGSTIPENAFWIISFATALAGLARERGTLLRLLRSSIPLLLLVLLAICSTAWSDDPATTLRRSVALVASGAVALCAVRRLGLREFVDTLGSCIPILAAISIFFIALIPEFGRTSDGEWQGCLGRKNPFAQLMELGLITLACASTPKSAQEGLLRIGLFASIAALLLGAKSGTSLVVTLLVALIGITLIWTRSRLRKHSKLLFALALGFVSVVGLSSGVFLDAALDALGKDTTLTGRTDVWQFTTEAIAERPLLGYGYKVFWLSNGAGDPSERTGTWATQAHNGFIEMGLDLGLVGIALTIFFLASAIYRAWHYFWYGSDRLSLWPLLVIGSLVITNFTEATVMKYYDVSWVVVVAAFLFSTEGKVPRSTVVPKTNAFQ